MILYFIFFFFSSRRRHTRLQGDWSSDVCSSDLTTFAGLAGLGDLVLTCTGTQSRNHALGREIARGRPLGLVEADTPMVAEGVRTVASVLRMAREAGVTMPICEEVAAVLFE